jgi:flagellar biosynthesis chaperone FliJ
MSLNEKDREFVDDIRRMVKQRTPGLSPTDTMRNLLAIIDRLSEELDKYDNARREAKEILANSNRSWDEQPDRRKVDAMLGMCVKYNEEGVALEKENDSLNSQLARMREAGEPFVKSYRTQRPTEADRCRLAEAMEDGDAS